MLVEEVARYYLDDAFVQVHQCVHAGIDATTCHRCHFATPKKPDGGCCNVGAFPHQEAAVDGRIVRHYAMNAHYDVGNGAGRAHTLRAHAHSPAAF